ncbi:MAG: hypothetical protein WCW35_05870 [Bacteroidota bacterium]|jgi:uncharacterized repeat protein (TIGR01451 family)
MKNTFIILFALSSIAFGQETSLNLYDYQLQANSITKTKSGKIGFISLKPVKNAKEEQAFGYWLSNNTNASAVFLEVKDGQKTIASVTAKDFSAKAKSQLKGTKTSFSYSTGSGANAVTIMLESDVITDETMPLGKVIQITVKAKAAGNKNLSAVMTLFGDGFVRKVGTNGISNSRTEKGKADFPFAIIVGNTGTTVNTDNAIQKSAGKLVKLTSATIASSGEEVELLSFRTHASTVKNFEKASKQAANIEQAVTNKKNVTEFSLLNSASKTNPFPGDTIIYYITYHNIGNSPGQDIVVSNDIPVNTFYVDGSAEGEDAEVTINRKKVVPPQQGEVISVSWKITKQVNPGEEGTVSLKAVIR